MKCKFPQDDMKKSFRYGLWYLVAIFVFAVIYWLMPQSSWDNSHIISSYWDALYYSIVTITTLGFGDITPQCCFAKVTTSAEVLIGIVLIGLFLNEISVKQAEKVNHDSKKRQEEEYKESATAKILRHIPLILPKINSFLLECYEVVMPINDRQYPEDIVIFSFNWNFKDMQDLYSPTLLLTNPLSSSAIENYFRTEHDLYDELKHLNDSTDVQLYPELQNMLYTFITECSDFNFEPVILSILNQFSGEGAGRKPLSALIKDMIAHHEGEVKFQDGNLINPYVALYYHLQKLIQLSQQLAQTMKHIQQTAIVNK